jgi:hypothetical protein
MLVIGERVVLHKLGAALPVLEAKVLSHFALVHSIAQSVTRAETPVDMP